MKNFSLNWPGVVALGLILAAVVLLEIFGEPGALLRLVEVALGGAALGGAALPTVLRRSGASKRSPRETIRPPLELVLLLVLACGAPVVVSGCATGTAAGATGAVIAAAPKIRDVSCNGARVMCRWMDTACRATGGPHVLPDAPPPSTSGGDEASPPPADATPAPVPAAVPAGPSSPVSWVPAGGLRFGPRTRLRRQTDPMVRADAAKKFLDELHAGGPQGSPTSSSRPTTRRSSRRSTAGYALAPAPTKS